jgi:hypothetical protein
LAKRKRKEQQPEETVGDAHEPPSVPPDGPEGPGDGAAGATAPESPTPSAAESLTEPAQPTRAERAVEKLRAVLARYFPRKKVELIDDGNAGGLGIKLTYDDPAERPSEEVKQILKAPDGNYHGFGFAGAIKQWRKAIGRDAEPKRAVAVRLDAERRFEAIGDRMSHEERLKAEREQGGPGPTVPS